MINPPKINRGTLPPLFDRIVYDKSGVAPLQKLLNTKVLEESIVNELSLILNTRCTVRKVIYDKHIESIPLFGLPDFFGLSDFSNFDGSNPQDWPKAARMIQIAIQAAEPRLTNVKVKVEKYSVADQSLAISIHASIRATDLLKEVHFPLTIYLKSTRSRKKAG